MPHPPLTTSYWPADTSAPVLDTTIGGVLRTAAERAPGQAALVAGDPSPGRRRQWSYGQLLAEAEQAARALLARFQPGERVAVWSGNCPEWVLLEFAAGLAGLTLVTVNPAYQAEGEQPAARDVEQRHRVDQGFPGPHADGRGGQARGGGQPSVGQHRGLGTARRARGVQDLRGTAGIDLR